VIAASRRQTSSFAGDAPRAATRHVTERENDLGMGSHGRTVSGRGVLAIVASVITLAICISFLIYEGLRLDPVVVLYAAIPAVGSALPLFFLAFRLSWVAFATGAFVLFLAGLWGALVGGLV
jgi:hypothetical protein